MHDACNEYNQGTGFYMIETTFMKELNLPISRSQSFSTPSWKYQKTSGFLMTSGGTE